LDKKNPLGSFVEWSVGFFRKLTAIQTVWSVAAYAVFWRLNLQQDKSRLFIIGANLICSLSAFAEGMRRMLKKERIEVERARPNLNI